MYHKLTSKNMAFRHFCCGAATEVFKADILQSDVIIKI